MEYVLCMPLYYVGRCISLLRGRRVAFRDWGPGIVGLRNCGTAEPWDCGT